jgi:hypothetical protein
MWYGHAHGVKDFGVTALAFGASDTVKSFNLPTDINGILDEIDFSVPVWTNNPTCTITVERGDGTIVFTGTARSKGAGVTYWVELPARVIVGGETIKATLSLAPGGSGGTVNVHPFGRGSRS